MSDLRLVIFDVDGTLVDSQNDIFAAISLAFQHEGLTPPDRSAALSIVGLSLPEAMRVLAPEAEDAARARMVTGYKDAYMSLRAQTGAAQSSPLYPGVREMLDDLAAQDNILLGVATGKSRRGLDKLLEAHDLRGMFVTEQVADFHPSKPHPSMIETCLRDAGVAQEHAAMIGDTEFDMNMAQAAGVHGIGVLWGYHDHTRLGQARILIEQVAEIPTALTQIWSEEP